MHGAYSPQDCKSGQDRLLHGLMIGQLWCSTMSCAEAGPIILLRGVCVCCVLSRRETPNRIFRMENDASPSLSLSLSLFVQLERALELSTTQWNSLELTETH